MRKTILSFILVAAFGSLPPNAFAQCGSPSPQRHALSTLLTQSTRFETSEAGVGIVETAAVIQAFPGTAPRMARAPSSTEASKLQVGTAKWIPRTKEPA